MNLEDIYVICRPEVGIRKNCARGLEYSRSRAQFFPIRTDQGRQIISNLGLLFWSTVARSHLPFMGIPIVCSFSVFCYQNNGVKEPTRSEFPTANSKSSLMTAIKATFVLNFLLKKFSSNLAYARAFRKNQKCLFLLLYCYRNP